MTVVDGRKFRFTLDPIVKVDAKDGDAPARPKTWANFIESITAFFNFETEGGMTK